MDILFRGEANVAMIPSHLPCRYPLPLSLYLSPQQTSVHDGEMQVENKFMWTY